VQGQLTQLNNGIAIQAIADQLIKEKEPFYIFNIDLDNFKTINYTFGMEYGDNVLKKYAGELMGETMSVNVAGRLENDSFVLILRDVLAFNRGQQKAEQLCSVDIDDSKDGKYRVSSSIGIAQFPSDGGGFEELVANSQKALDNARSQGGNCFSFYGANMADDGGKKHNKLTGKKESRQAAGRYMPPGARPETFYLLIIAVSQNIAMRYFARKCYAANIYIARLRATIS
jgi:diguanylate cyclase (GGDEF)-like protein